MERQNILRYGIPLVILVVLGGLYLGLHDASERLLSPPPSGLFGITLLVIVPLGIGCSYLIAKDLPSRLGRRLAVIATMAVCLFAGGVSSRGIYAISAFDGDLQTATENWMTLNGSGGSITALSLERRNKTITLAADPDAAAAAGPGQCVSVQIQKMADGAERIDPQQPKVSTADLLPCPGLQRL